MEDDRPTTYIVYRKLVVGYMDLAEYQTYAEAAARRQAEIAAGTDPRNVKLRASYVMMWGPKQ